MKKRLAILSSIAILFAVLGISTTAQAQVKNIVLVHGAWADGSGWEPIYKILKSKGYNVSVVGNPDVSLTEDVMVTKAVLARQTGPVLLVGHSYGGAVITEAGDTSSVVGLVYISAFAPEVGESTLKIASSGAPNPEAGFLPPANGFVWYDVAKFYRDFCPDLPKEKADFMSISQLPLGLAAFAGEITRAAWKTKPSWFIVSSDDRMVPPDAQRMMAKRAGSKITEIKGSHCTYISHAKEVAAVIEAAAIAAGK